MIALPLAMRTRDDGPTRFGIVWIIHTVLEDKVNTNSVQLYHLYDRLQATSK
jgi:hypothetical protein